MRSVPIELTPFLRSDRDEKAVGGAGCSDSDSAVQRMVFSVRRHSGSNNRRGGDFHCAVGLFRARGILPGSRKQSG